MAQKSYFYYSLSESEDKIGVLSEDVYFRWYPQATLEYKQRSISAMHLASGKKLLEVSPYATTKLGCRLSSFELSLKCPGSLKRASVESVYQSGKVFENGGPYREILDMSPEEARKYPKLKTSGKLKGFEDLEGDFWTPEEGFRYYDYLYAEAAHQRFLAIDVLSLEEYDGFTDTEYVSHSLKRSSARAVAVVMMLNAMNGEITEVNKYKDDFLALHRLYVNC